MLSDSSIRAALLAGSIVVHPIDDLERRLQPASLDVRLGPDFLVLRNLATCVDPKVDSSELFEAIRVPHGGHFVIHPGEFVLAATLERVQLGRQVAARIDGKSSLGRLGLVIHSTAGWIDPGWLGDITLELSNVATLPIKLYPGMPIGQLAFDELDEPAEAPYAGKYQGQRGPVASAYHRNWNGNHW